MPLGNQFNFAANDGLDLAQKVHDFAEAAKANPAMVTPDILDQLEVAADSAMFGSYAAPAIPASPLSWEARTLFLGSSSVSERIAVDIPYAVLITGAYASISVLTTGSSGTPTEDDIDVAIDLNTQRYMTQGQGTYTTSTSATPQVGGSTFVTLASVSQKNTQGSRLFGWKIVERQAQLGVTFRWAQGASVYHDTIVKLTFYARQLTA